ncbi:TonB-dependent receptor plug domain-containing protein [Novosphingobium sp. Leaf2]|uniref:TonB-dependent receptor plug domain-containing protein n=1 Tax=Novosphingobium sp. Leaf2 TaxID=1735670 RepID=UPI0006F864B4|nr:TonB-dependent receptor [Novosphingobium sp. Leaf2]KQM18707.1 TonB-dependent receptor [Novosphingobium sp. Leaf2]
MKSTIQKAALCGATSLSVALLCGTAYAQDATPQAADTADDANTIVVTGSLLRAPVLTSPVTSISTDNLDQRGISTTQEGIQRLSANNGPALTNSFSANGAFAAGASAVSLRGLTTNSTLTLFDGMRAAFYPLADDGTRNFVDLNTIPDDIVESVEVLRDGASATYGADAIAGVVNIITKKQIQGISGRAEAGISDRGDAATQRLSLTAGFGDLETNGLNAYVSGFYYHQDPLYNRQRPYPYNSDDYRQICNDGTCGVNGVVNGVQTDGYTGGFGAATPFAVRPRNPLTGGAIPGVSSRYTYLNGCQGLPTYTPTAAELALGANASAPASGPVCQEDVTNLYGVINPEIERYGLSARMTARVNDDTEAYASFNFTQATTQYSGLPATIRANAPAPFYYPRYSTSANVAAYGNNTVLQLPVYVCARSTIGACTAANGTLNPNNPYAAQGQTAAIIGRLPDLQEYDQSRTRAFRGAIGIKGKISDDWNYTVNATAMHMDLQRRSNGYVYIQHLLDVIKDGSYNFRNPSANTQETLDYLAPEARATSTSDLAQIDANVSGKLADLPGGPLQVAVGVSYRYEAVDSPSLNSDFNGPTQRYFRLNGFALKGSRSVYSAYAEVNAPIVDQLTVNASGRYDRYPNGIDNFSPKIGAILRPLSDDRVIVRGTYSRGFRIPSFGEANATFPTTGYVTANAATYTDSFLAQYGCSKATFTSCPTYLTSATYGATSVSNPNLKPEKSRSFTAGIELRPMRGVKLSADYYNIRKTNVITTANNAPAIAAYYSGQAIPAGYQVIADAPDVNNENATPRIAFVQSAFINANTMKTDGFDFSAELNLPITDNLSLTTMADATYIRKLETVFPDGTVERYDGTLGNFNLTAGSGTPKWKGTWTTALAYRQFTLAGTLNFFDGYDLSAMDQGTGYKDCGLDDGSLPCRVKSYITFDLNLQVKINDKFTFYFTGQNVFDRLPPIDTVTYGAHAYNPIQGGEGILGRYFKAGVKFGF